MLSQHSPGFMFQHMKERARKSYYLDDNEGWSTPYPKT